MYFEIIYKDTILITGDDLLQVDFAYDLNSTPNFSIDLPLKYYHYLDFRSEIKLHFDDGTMLHGIIVSRKITKSQEIVSCEYEHIFYEWTFESIPVNVVKKNTTVSNLMKDPDMIYQKKNWSIDVHNDYPIEYEFSRENKREGLEKIIELTPDLSYRVLRNSDRYLEIGKFGEHKQFLISFDNIVDDLVITDDSSVISNYAVALSDKSEGGATTITLRDVFEHPELEMEGFPVIITGNTINTQAPQVGYRFTEYAPNNIEEYAVIDEYGIMQECGDIYETTVSTNDIQPIQENGKPITNADRINSAKMLYQQTVRRLIHGRRRKLYECSVAYLPSDINVGDKVRLLFENKFDEFYGCSGVNSVGAFSVDAWVYVIRIQLHFQSDGSVVYDLVLSENLSSIYGEREV